MTNQKREDFQKVLNENTKILEENRKKNETKGCPRCLKTYTGEPAISRRDNKAIICSDCGVAEAMEDFSNRLK